MKQLPSYEKSFNRNVLAVVCLVGLVRVVLEMDRNTSSWGDLDLTLDISYGLMFILTLVALWRKLYYETIRLTFYIPLILLLCLTLFDRKGLASSVETNTYIALIIISLTMRSKDAIRFSGLLILGTLISLFFVERKYHFFEDFSVYSTSHFNFIFMSVGSVVVTYYAKKIFEDRKKSLSEMKENLSRNHEILKQSSEQLEAKTQELEALNRKLEAKVEERVALLNEKKKAMKEYLHLTSEELQIEYEGIYQLTDESFGNAKDHMSQMMIESSSRLDLEIKALVNKLKEEA